MVIAGPLCYYIKCKQGTITSASGSDNYIIESKNMDYWPDDWYSLTPNGEIMKFKDKIFKKYLEDNGLTEEFKNDPKYKPDGNSSWNAAAPRYYPNATNQVIRFVKVLNTKMK